MSDSILTGSELDRMIEREAYILEALTAAYQLGVFDYALFSPAYDTTLCRKSALQLGRDALNATVEESRAKFQPEGE